jgi:hypothetical protein
MHESVEEQERKRKRKRGEGLHNTRRDGDSDHRETIARCTGKKRKDSRSVQRQIDIREKKFWKRDLGVQRARS